MALVLSGVCRPQDRATQTTFEWSFSLNVARRLSSRRSRRDLTAISRFLSPPPVGAFLDRLAHPPGDVISPPNVTERGVGFCAPGHISPAQPSSYGFRISNFEFRITNPRLQTEGRRPLCNLQSAICNLQFGIPPQPAGLSSSTRDVILRIRRGLWRNRARELLYHHANLLRQ